jgi:hypothetical protein
MSYVFPAALAPELRAPQPLRLRWRRLRRAVWTAAGLLLMIAGAAALVVPGHLTFAALGLVVVLRNSPQARRIFVRVQRRRPKWVYPLRRLLRRKPEVWPVMWQGLLRAERLVLVKAGRWRVLKRLRRSLRRRFAPV